MLRRTRHPYAVEVIGDPYDVLAPGAVRHPLRPFLRWWKPRELRRQCSGACAASYVTTTKLQQRYPPAPDAFTTHYSSIDLPGSAIVDSPRDGRRPVAPHSTLVFVGSLDRMYKAPDVLLDAVAQCVSDGLDLRLVLIGDGKHRRELEARAEALELQRHIAFRGQLAPGDAVRSELDHADLFVLPSRTEGLPRAMIEAMARGLPCVGSAVGGIPELLPPEDMVPPGDADSLARKIAEMITNPQRMMRASARNLENAKQYNEDLLRERRIAFYQHVRQTTETWLKQ